MNRTKLLALLLAVVLVTGLFAACSGNGGAQQQAQPAPAENGAEGDAPLRVALIGRNFGDGGPVEDMSRGADRAVAEFGVQLNRLESDSPASFEEDIRAMAAQNDLVITAFPWMSDAVVMVAGEFPETQFSSIFQFINAGERPVPNVWSIEFHGQAAFYIAGYLAGQTTQTGRVGLIIGGEEPTPNAEGNAFMRGVMRANPDAVVDFAFVGSYEDPARAYEIATAMISGGVDVLQTSAGASNAGVVEAAMEAGVAVAGEITDFYDVYPGFMGIVGIGFGEMVYQSIAHMVGGTFPSGEHGISDLVSGGYFIDWDSYSRFAQSNAEFGPALGAAIASAREIEQEILSGALSIAFDPTVPSWDRISQE